MRIHFQRSNTFYLTPRIRIYRRPLLIWLRWFGRSAFIAGSEHTSQDRKATT